MKKYEIVRTRDLESIYIIAENPLDAILKHWRNLDKIKVDKHAKIFNTGYSYILIHNKDVYCLVYRINTSPTEEF